MSSGCKVQGRFEMALRKFHVSETRAISLGAEEYRKLLGAAGTSVA